MNANGQTKMVAPPHHIHTYTNKGKQTLEMNENIFTGGTILYINESHERKRWDYIYTVSILSEDTG